MIENSSEASIDSTNPIVQAEMKNSTILVENSISDVNVSSDVVESVVSSPLTNDQCICFDVSEKFPLNYADMVAFIEKKIVLTAVSPAAPFPSLESLKQLLELEGINDSNLHWDLWRDALSEVCRIHDNPQSLSSESSKDVSEHKVSNTIANPNDIGQRVDISNKKVIEEEKKRLSGKLAKQVQTPIESSEETPDRESFRKTSEFQDDDVRFSDQSRFSDSSRLSSQSRSSGIFSALTISSLSSRKSRFTLMSKSPSTNSSSSSWSRPVFEKDFSASTIATYDEDRDSTTLRIKTPSVHIDVDNKERFSVASQDESQPEIDICCFRLFRPVSNNSSSHSGQSGSNISPTNSNSCHPSNQQAPNYGIGGGHFNAYENSSRDRQLNARKDQEKPPACEVKDDETNKEPSFQVSEAIIFEMSCSALSPIMEHPSDEESSNSHDN